MVIDESNFLLVAMHHYQNPSCCTLDEFEEDLKRITYVKKQIAKPEKNVRLLLNHIIVLFNVFGNAALYMLFYKIEKQYWSQLVTFLVYISRMPDFIPEHKLHLTDIVLDETIIKELRKI